MDTMIRDMLMVLICQFGGDKVFEIADEIVKGRKLSINVVDKHILDNLHDFSRIDFIPRIKAVRQLTGMGLINAKLWVEEKFPNKGRILNDYKERSY